MLRRVDPIGILNNYLKDTYSTLTIPENKIAITSYVKMGKSLGTDPEEEVYRLKDKTVTGKTVVTTNHTNYKWAKDKTDNKAGIRPQQRCWHCKRIIVGEAVGIPLELETDLYTTSQRFYTDGCYCNFSCAYSDLKRQLRVSKVYKDPLYVDAEALLYSLYYKIYPDKMGTRIKEAPDWRLLNENGGPLTSTQFDDKTFIYKQVPTLVTIPCKRQYVKLNIK